MPDPTPKWLPEGYRPSTLNESWPETFFSLPLSNERLLCFRPVDEHKNSAIFVFVADNPQNERPRLLGTQLHDFAVLNSGAHTSWYFDGAWFTSEINSSKGDGQPNASWEQLHQCSVIQFRPGRVLAVRSGSNIESDALVAILDSID